MDQTCTVVVDVRFKLQLLVGIYFPTCKSIYSKSRYINLYIC